MSAVSSRIPDTNSMYCPVICPSRLHIWPQQPRFHQESLLHTRGHRVAHQAKRPCSHTCKRSFPLTLSLALLPVFHAPFSLSSPLLPPSYFPTPTITLPLPYSAGATINQALRDLMRTSFSSQSIAWCVPLHHPAAPSHASPCHPLHCTCFTPVLLCVSLIQVHSAACVVCVGRKWPPSSPGRATQPRTEGTR